MIKFHKVGTKHKSYVERFEKKIGSFPHFEIDFVDSHKININFKGKMLDNFTSRTTYDQFIKTLMSLGMIESESKGYKVLIGVFDWNAVTNAIFSIHYDDKINILRDSRKICLLAKLNLLNGVLFPIKIKKSKGTFEYSDAIAEASMWERKTMESIDKTIDVLKRIKHEYKV